MDKMELFQTHNLFKNWHFLKAVLQNLCVVMKTSQCTLDHESNKYPSFHCIKNINSIHQYIQLILKLMPVDLHKIWHYTKSS